MMVTPSEQHGFDLDLDLARKKRRFVQNTFDRDVSALCQTDGGHWYMDLLEDADVTLLSYHEGWAIGLQRALEKYHFKTSAGRTPEALPSSAGLNVTDDARLAIKLKRQNLNVLYAPQSQTLLETRDQIVNHLFPPPKLQKRNFTRVPVNIDVTWTLTVLESEPLFIGQVENVSERGAFITPSQILPNTKDIIALEFTQATGDAVITYQGLGIVRWLRQEVEPQGFGVEFVKPVKGFTASAR